MESLLGTLQINVLIKVQALVPNLDEFYKKFLKFTSKFHLEKKKMTDYCNVMTTTTIWKMTESSATYKN